MESNNIELPSENLAKKIVEHFSLFGTEIVYLGKNLNGELEFDFSEYFWKVEKLEDKILSKLKAREVALEHKDLVVNIKLTEKEFRLKKSYI